MYRVLLHCVVLLPFDSILRHGKQQIVVHVLLWHDLTVTCRDWSNVRTTRTVQDMKTAGTGDTTTPRVARGSEVRNDEKLGLGLRSIDYERQSEAFAPYGTFENTTSCNCCALEQFNTYHIFYSNSGENTLNTANVNVISASMCTFAESVCFFKWRME